jgi:transcriptional regulator GlxA family with amidase domain
MKLRLVRADARPDPQVEKAMALMRADLDARWTVARLARAVGLSRAAFARRFAASQGVSPLRYLTRLRMERAAQLLGATDAGLSRIASDVGYASEFAFNRAFKRFYLRSPGAFRSLLRTSTTPMLRAA